jgi:acyl-CoA thioesterase II
MSEDAVQELLELLDLQGRGEGVFVGPPARHAAQRVFGGQLLAQALAAASFTAPDDWPCHSLHAYFVRPGKPGRPIDYEVMAMRDGQRFSTRKVVAVQRDEVALELLASFESEESGPEQQLPAPEAPAPESFPPEAERLAKQLEQAKTPEQRAWIERRMPVEIIPIDPRSPGEPPRSEPIRSWLRVRGRLPDDPRLHRCALAYASDLGALEPCMRAIGAAFGDTRMQVASLDHALWFHRPFRADEWLLFRFESVSVAAGRGLSRATIHDREGRLVASLSQEGLMRERSALAPE